MSKLNLSRARNYLQSFDFANLFIEELGWSIPRGMRGERFAVNGRFYTRQPIAELSGVVVFEVSAADGDMPDAKTRLAVQSEIARLFHENVLIFLDGQRRQCVFYWVKRDDGRRAPRSHTFVAGQSGDLLLSKLQAMFVDLSELDDDGRIPVVEVARRVQAALDVERVTKRFYDEFKAAHTHFLEHIGGIDNEQDRRWYTSVILNRLMFVYFLQKKGFINNGDQNYLQRQLAASKERGPDRYYSEFLQLLFFEGFAHPPGQRSEQARRLLGKIRYLNGGLFLKHPIEQRWPAITIPDRAFAELFDLFGRYSWNLDDRPGGRDDEINPDVLGYIFEKYINQKAFGAYYTRPEITEYLSEQTIHKLVLDQLAEMNQPLPGLPPPPHFESVGDLLLKLDATRCNQLLQTVLPGLRLLDPACGSGAFLVAAMKTLLEIYRGALGRIPALRHSGLNHYLAEIDRLHPSRDYFIKKQIITHNLFGVDIMEEAVEIARLRLFLALVASAEKEDDLEPLPNIDFNILPGNSLIGLLQVDESRFNAFTGGNHGQGSLLALMQASSYRRVVEEKTAMVEQYRNAAERPDLRGNSGAVQALRNRIDDHRRANAAVLNQLLLEDFQGLGIQFEGATWDSQRNKAGKPQKRPLTERDIQALQPFHWGYEFHEVINERGGFDAIITNPPWEIWKPQAKEFFAEYADVVMKNKMTIKAFEKEQARLLQNAEIRAAWLDYLSRFPHQSAYYRSAAPYQHQTAVVDGRKTGSDINLYKLFTEQCYNLLREGGLCGTVIPSGIYTDLGATGLRRMLFEKTQIQGLFGFENRNAIFEGVHRSFKFVVLTFIKGGRTERFPATFMRLNVATLADFPANALEMSVALVRRLSPGPLSLMEFNDPLDVVIAEKMLAFPLLGEEVAGTWQVSFTSEFHMTNDSGIFRTAPGDGRLPLYEGKMIHQFTHNFAQPRYWVDEQEGRRALLGRREDEGQLLDYQTYRLAFRDVARNTDSRTLISTLIHPTFHGNTMPTVKVFSQEGTNLIDSGTQLFLCGLLNSFVVDWQIRLRVTTHVNYFFLNQVSIPRLTSFNPIFGPVVERAAKLICTTPEFDELAAEVGLGDHRSGVTDAAERAQLRTELDALVAHLYQLSEAEFAHILGTFPLVAEEVKAAALAEYRRLAPSPALLALLRGGESQTVEFKAAACRNPYSGKPDNNIRNGIVRAVAALLNSDGGTLLIGVGDDGTVLGVEDEYAIANPSKGNWDGYALFLADLLNKRLSLPAAFQYYQLHCETVEGHQVAVISVQPGPEATYVNDRLYVRSGGQTRELHGPELIAYVDGRFESR